MYKQKVRMRNVTVLFTLLTVLAGLLLLALLDYVDTGRYRDLSELIILLLTVVSLLLGLQRTKRCYVYYCIGDRLLVKKVNGILEKVMLDVSFTELRALLPPGDPARDAYRGVGGRANFAGSPGSRDKYLLVYQVNGFFFRCCMEPDHRLRELLAGAVEKNCKREAEAGRSRTRGQLRDRENGEQ